MEETCWRPSGLAGEARCSPICLVQWCGLLEIHPPFSQSCSEAWREAHPRCGFCIDRPTQLLRIPWVSQRREVSFLPWPGLRRLCGFLPPLPGWLHAPLSLLTDFYKYSPTSLVVSVHILGPIWTSLSDFSFSHPICSKHLKITTSTPTPQWMRMGLSEDEAVPKIIHRASRLPFHSEMSSLPTWVDCYIYDTIPEKGAFEIFKNYSLLLKSIASQEESNVSDSEPSPSCTVAGMVGM